MAVLDFSTIKHEVFPTVAAVFSKTSSLGIKIRGLQAFVILCGGLSDNNEALGDGLDGASQPSKSAKASNNAVLDKYTVQEKIVPLLKAMKTKEPAVMMAALAVFNQVGRIADTEFLATECLPVLWAFSLGPLLNLQQFQEYMALIKSLSTRVENEQMRKLRELSSGSTATRSNDLMNVGSTDSFFGNGEDVGENDFERLVLGRGTSSNSSNMLGDSFRPQPQRAQSSRAVTPVFSWSTPSMAPAQNNVNGASSVNSISHPAFSIAPPPKSTSRFPQYSIAPPPSHTQPSIPSQNGYLVSGPTVQANGVLQPNQKKTGLDAYESLL